MNKNKTIGELLDEARKNSGEPVLAGHDIMALERFGEDTRHMIVFDVLSHSSPVGWKGERMRLFLTDAGYQKALESQDRNEIKIRKHAKVIRGDISMTAPKKKSDKLTICRKGGGIIGSFQSRKDKGLYRHGKSSFEKH